MSDKPDKNLLPLIKRIADALERRSPPAPGTADLDAADAFVWHADGSRLEPVAVVSRVELELLRGIDRQRETLLENTRRFARAMPSNNALLWGARGTGKSSLIKAVHAAVNAETPGAVVLVEIHREEIPSLPALLKVLRGGARRCVLFCDDLSFDSDDTSYLSLKGSSKAASKAARKTWSSTPPRTAAT